MLFNGIVFLGDSTFTDNFWRKINFWILGYLFAKIMDAPCEKVCQIFIAALDSTWCTQMQFLPCQTIPTSLETFSRRKDSTIVYYVSLVRAATGSQRKPGTVCLRKVDTERGVGHRGLAGWVTGVRWVTHPARHCSGKLSWCDRGSVK